MDIVITTAALFFGTFCLTYNLLTWRERRKARLR